MNNCFDCEFAEFDTEEYYGGYHEKIVTGCKLEREPETCEEEEVSDIG